MIKVERTNSDHPAFQSLVVLLDRELRGEYQELQDYYGQFNKVPGLQTVVLVFDGDEAVGCGCFKPFDESAVEIKRMYVTESHRGSGAASAVLNELERWATELGYRQAVLETGNKQLAALRFYHKQGYRQTENYGQYIGMETSICMKKPLTTDPTASASR